MHEIEDSAKLMLQYFGIRNSLFEIRYSKNFKNLQSTFSNFQSKNLRSYIAACSGSI